MQDYANNESLKFNTARLVFRTFENRCQEEESATGSKGEGREESNAADKDRDDANVSGRVSDDRSRSVLFHNLHLIKIKRMHC